MKKIIYLIILTTMFFSCGKNDDPEMPTKPTIQHKLSLSKQETFNGTNVNLTTDPVSFKVDSLNRISEISIWIYKYTISYPNSNLIRIFSDQSTVSTTEKYTTNIYLENNTVKKICSDNQIKYNDKTQDNENELDSTIFTYNSNNNLTRIYFFKKALKSTVYKLLDTYEYTYEAGNVTQFISHDYTGKKVLNYSYDNQPNIDYGEYARDMPFLFTNYYPLIRNKLGKGNVNNVIKVTYTYLGDPLDLRNFDYINYERVLDSNGLLSAIKMSGQFTDTYTKTATKYNDGKISFTYQ